MNLSAVLATVALASAATAQPLQPTTQDVREAVTAQSYTPYAEPRFLEWRQDLQERLSRMSLEAASDGVAAKYGLPAAEMRRLVSAWVIAQSRQFGPDHAWVPRVRAELYAVAPRLRSDALAAAIIAEALDATTEDCSADDFNLLLQDSRDPAATGYFIAAASACVGNFARAATAAGDRATPALIRMAEYGGLPPRDLLPLDAWLTGPDALAHVRDADRRPLSALLWRRYLTALFEAGFSEKALAAFDSLPADLRAAVVSPQPRAAFAATVDGLPLIFRGEDKEESGSRLRDLSSIEAPIQELAEAMAVAGREDEARQLLSSLPGLAEAKAAGACAYQWTKGSPNCPESRRLPMGALALDHWLNDRAADPYPIAETILGRSSFFGLAAGKEIRCRVFPKEDYPDVCTLGADDSYFSETDTPPQELALVEAALEKSIAGFSALRASMLGVHDQPARPRAERWRQATIAAVPPDFAEKPIPPEYAGAAAEVVPKGLAPLPDGFALVRAERQGKRAVAISVSQTYDPTGEVSQGGYWVHVSEDGGEHWEAPLYTGLADRFPYVVAPASRLPLIAGETLQLAVDVSEIDTASISYPPVGLRTRRRAQNRYLSIPLAELRRDSDGDGLTDLAAHHLLLDRPRSKDSTPFVVGSDYDADCRKAPSDEKLALIELLGRMTGSSGAAVVEPVDRRANALMVGWRHAAAAGDQPLFLLGRPDDYNGASDGARTRDLRRDRPAL
jgi:hypothetical protein